VPEPFYFFSELHLVRLLGVKAKNPSELLEHIKQVPPSAIYYHTHRFLQQHHYLSPEPPNDFAYWVTNILGLEALGESLASVDIVRFATIDELRNEFIRIPFYGLRDRYYTNPLCREYVAGISEHYSKTEHPRALLPCVRGPHAPA
jgi:hypothetical protein